MSVALDKSTIRYTVPNDLRENIKIQSVSFFFENTFYLKYIIERERAKKMQGKSKKNKKRIGI